MTLSVAIQGGSWVLPTASTTSLARSARNHSSVRPTIFRRPVRPKRPASSTSRTRSTRRRVRRPSSSRPGTYTEIAAATAHRSNGGLYINKPDLTLQGVKPTARRSPSASRGASDGPTIISGHQDRLRCRPYHWVDFGGDNTVFQGLHLQIGRNRTNRSSSRSGRTTSQFENSFIDVNAPNTGYSGAVAIYINDNGTALTRSTPTRSTGNILNEGIVVANGVGDPPRDRSRTSRSSAIISGLSEPGTAATTLS